MEHEVREVVSAIITILVVSFFLHLAARFVANRPPFSRSVMVAVLGSIAAGLVAFLLPGALGLVLAVLVWLAVAAALYNIGLLRALGLGLVAYVLFLLTRWLVMVVADALGRGA